MTVVIITDAINKVIGPFISFYFITSFHCLNHKSQQVALTLLSLNDILTR